MGAAACQGFRRCQAVDPIKTRQKKKKPFISFLPMVKAPTARPPRRPRRRTRRGAGSSGSRCACATSDASGPPRRGPTRRSPPRPCARPRRRRRRRRIPSAAKASWVDLHGALQAPELLQDGAFQLVPVNVELYEEHGQRSELGSHFSWN